VSYQVRLQQGSTIVDLDKVQVVPVRIGSLTAEHDNPGGSPKLQWVGRKTKVIELQGLLLGSTAKSTVDDILSFQGSKNAVQLTLQTYGFTWMQSVSHYIINFSYELQPGTPDADETQKVKYHITFKHIN
jgi:hypothetical protein